MAGFYRINIPFLSSQTGFYVLCPFWCPRHAAKGDARALNHTILYIQIKRPKNGLDVLVTPF